MNRGMRKNKKEKERKEKGKGERKEKEGGREEERKMFFFFIAAAAPLTNFHVQSTIFKILAPAAGSVSPPRSARI